MRPILTLPVGTVFFAIALLMERFLPATNLFDFLAGLFIGLSIVLNLSYAWHRSRKRISS